MTVEGIINQFETALTVKGFACQPNLSLGLATAALHAFRNVLWWLCPYSLHYYVFEIEDDASLTPEYIEALHALACHRRSASRRSFWRGFITATVVISSRGFPVGTVNSIVGRKQPQLMNPNTIFLFDLVSRELHCLKKVGFASSLPLIWVKKYTREIFQSLV